MRMGPGNHLKGLTLAEGLVKAEEVLLHSISSTTCAERDARVSCSSITSMS